MWSISQMCIISGIIGLSVWDIKTHTVPMSVLIISTFLVITYQIVYHPIDWYLILGGGMVGVLFLLLGRLTREQIGFGDGWLILVLGLYYGIWEICTILCCAFFLSAVVSGIGLARGMNRKTRLPFVPFLCMGVLGVSFI